MGVGGLFVSSHAGYGVAYYGGLLFFAFAVLFVMLLIKVSVDDVKEVTAAGEFGALFVKVTAILKPVTRSTSPGPAVVRSIATADLRDALARGIADFKVQPTHLIILCLIYPLAGLILWKLTAGYDVLPVLFPLVSGFALIGPLAATGLYELSRRREQGLDFSWWHVFAVLRSPSLPAIVALGVTLAVIFVAWLGAAQMIYERIFGNWVPASFGEFAREVFMTNSGWTLIIVGCAVGLVFAVVVMTISVVSLPMLLDRDVGAARAVQTSIRAVLANPGAMAVWGFIVVGTLLIGALPFFVGLAVVLPVLGHSTWHLYRKVVAH